MRDLLLWLSLASPQVKLRLSRVFLVVGGATAKKGSAPSIFRNCWVMWYSVIKGCVQERSRSVEIWLDGRGWCLWYAAKHFTLFLSQKPYKTGDVTHFSEEESEAQKSTFSRAIELDLDAAGVLSYPEPGLLVMCCGVAVSLVFVKSAWVFPGYLPLLSLFRLLALHMLLLWHWICTPWRKGTFILTFFSGFLALWLALNRHSMNSCWMTATIFPSPLLHRSWH